MKRYFFLILILHLAVFGINSQDSLRIEPPNWWAGMNNEALQLLIHFDNAAHYDKASVDNENISIESIVKVESPNYLFVNLILGKELKPGKFNFKLISDTSPAMEFEYEIRKRRSGSAKRKSFDAADVIYLVMPDRFANGDQANDNVPGLKDKANRSIPFGRHGGDIQGIIDHLDYLEDLGITAIWSTPLLLDNEETYSYHTYAISDFYSIDPRYGHNKDYRRLADSCHQRGIKLIMDMVPNHCAATHWWMQDLPQQDWVHQFNKFTRSNHRKQTVNDPYKDEKDYRLYEEGWFDVTMPDLNQSNDLLLKYLSQNAIWWIEFADLDGLRVDTYTYNEKKKISEWTASILNEFPNLNIVGETWQKLPSEIAYWQSGNNNKDGYDSYLPSVMDFCLNEDLKKVFNENHQGWDQGVVRLYDRLTKDFLYANPKNLMVFCDNHDMTRYSNIVDHDIRKYKLAFSFLLTTRGIPQIYYGSEIMMKGDKARGDSDLRKDFPGGWPDDKRNAFFAEERTKNENDVFNHFKKLLNWRQTSKAVKFGNLRHFIPENNIYVYIREHEEDVVVVIINNNEEEKNLQFEKYLNGPLMNLEWRNVMDDTKQELSGEKWIDGKSVLIMQKNQHEE